MDGGHHANRWDRLSGGVAHARHCGRESARPIGLRLVDQASPSIVPMFRKQLVSLLLDNPMTVMEIARQLDERPKDVEEDLKHLIRSLKTTVYRGEVLPAHCRKCGFSFKKEKVRRPGKCPMCHGTWITEPRLAVRKQNKSGHISVT